jgi:pilus assembly protein CpaC
VILSSRRAYITGNNNGATNIIFLDAQGNQMARFDIAVAPDVEVIRRAIRKRIRSADIDVEAIGDGIVLTGTVSSQADAQQACDVASHFLVGDSFAGSSSTTLTNSNSSSNSSASGSAGGSGGSTCKVDKVVNAIVVTGRDQVMLKVTVAEMDRTVIKQLGVNLNGSLSLGTSVVNFNNNNPFPVNGALSTLAIAPGVAANNILTATGTPATPATFTQPAQPATGLSSSAPGTIGGTFKGITANLQAMEQVGVVHTLAEPTLTAISGESAHFLVGGQFPYPTPATSIGSLPGISFQNFGVQLNFNPVVLSEGRISLHVATEVSELNDSISVTVAGTTVPGLTVRRADTTAEISSGGTLVMAGMLQEQTKHTITGIPGAMQLPILGALFSSNDYLNNQTELVVLVTPYIAHAVAQKDLSRPDDGFADPSDPASVLLGRLSRIYGVDASPPSLPYHGNIGFILD